VPDWDHVRYNVIWMHFFCFFGVLISKYLKSKTNNVNVTIIQRLVEFVTFPIYIACML
jgi:hypothetical protein